jgi:hypothetical protein
MITPFKYRFRLGKNNPRHINGKRIVVLHGTERYIDCNEVEFCSDRKLTVREFQLATEGTIGIEQIFGDFVEEYRNDLIEYNMWASLVTREHAEIIVDAYLKQKNDPARSN